MKEAKISSKPNTSTYYNGNEAQYQCHYCLEMLLFGSCLLHINNYEP